jgi:mono/diheme cytochrome c family protein
MQGRDPKDFASGVADNKGRIQGRQQIANALYAMFGTPDEPFVFEESGLDLAKVKLASGPFGSSEDGTQQGLYRQHCAHCHGITGDGAGPTAQFLNPYPRDYRRGIYKFKSTERIARPTSADLHRILHDGIPGTAMPSFMLLPKRDLEALVEYVKYLSIRGEVEASMAFSVYDQEEELEMKRESLVEQHLKPVAENWANAEQLVIQVPEHPPVSNQAEWLAKGAELFRGAKAQCMKCHGPTALGDGSEEALFDDWNKDKKPELLSTWLLRKQEVKPRNLRLGIYRFGRSPADMYRRVHAGINGGPMPGGFIAAGNPGNLKPEEIWQLVDYIRTLPYESFSVPHETSVTVNRVHN